MVRGVGEIKRTGPFDVEDLVRRTRLSTTVVTEGPLTWGRLAITGFWGAAP